MDKYGLIGGKLGHSLSPKIHEYIFGKLKIDASYELIECNKEDLSLMVSKLKTGEYNGFNVTIPHKIEVMKYLDVISPEALEIGAVNTISVQNGKTVGTNTDYYGFIEALKHYKFNVAGKNVIMLGSGGAAKAIYAALKNLNANIIVAVRMEDYEIAKTFGFAILLDEIKNYQYDYIVNTTPVGMYPNVNDCVISKEVIEKAQKCFDVIYNPSITRFMSYAKCGYNGLYMLVSQAIKAEEIFQKKEIGIIDMVYAYVEGLL